MAIRVGTVASGCCGCGCLRAAVGQADATEIWPALTRFCARLHGASELCEHVHRLPHAAIRQALSAKRATRYAGGGACIRGAKIPAIHRGASGRTARCRAGAEFAAAANTGGCTGAHAAAVGDGARGRVGRIAMAEDLPAMPYAYFFSGRGTSGGGEVEHHGALVPACGL